MQCELCGASIQGPAKIVLIEGARLSVCVRCSKHGTEVQQTRGSPGAAKKVPGTAPQPKRRPRDVFDLIEGDIVEDYNERIRAAREVKGWSQQDLAREIKEREVLIKKLEKHDLIPEDDLRKKLEKVLEISLIDAATDELKSRGAGKLTTTVGDLISLKKLRK
jgi:putative transcription factor